MHTNKTKKSDDNKYTKSVMQKSKKQSVDQQKTYYQSQYHFDDDYEKERER